MDEHYTSTYHSVEARADNANFKRFTVDVKLDLGPVPR
jgi:hypothetical protein